ncbi:MAG: hypothetical protein J6C55_01695 [Oscillospiraceae bacterium]|nr:hypothetical protein [Oscillospiraceae bacterium]
MANNQFYPFERNRYYYGKLLTTSDLEAEQKYINNKRQFINKLVFGSGKICGLKVYNINEDTLMVESGVAIDEDGREIVVDKSEIKKLSAIEGFSQVASDKMLLTIEYNEELTQPVYSVAQNNNGKEYEYNKIIENYRLKLKEYVEVDKELEIEEGLVYNKEIYKNENFKISIKIPTVASLLSDFKIITVVEKLTDIKESINFKYTINIPGFVSGNSGERLFVDIKDLFLEKNKSYLKESWIKPGNLLSQDSVNFVIKKEDVKLSFGNTKYIINDNILFQIDISDKEPVEIINTKVKNESLEKIIREKANSDIVIAIIEVSRIGLACEIKDVRVPVESRYSVKMPSQVPCIDKIMNYYECNKKLEIAENNKIKDSLKNSNFEIDFRKKINTVISSGVFEMPLGLGVKANKAILSDEIMHGLGSGDVYVDVGFEFLTATKDKKDSYIKKIIFGNPEIFKDDGATLPSVETAVQVLSEKGTFIVGLKFSQVTNLVSVRIKWFAYRQLDNISRTNIGGENKGIYVKQDTIKLTPGEMHFIEVGFSNMNPTAVRYEIIDKDGGEIDENGCYTAPGKDGVYEIKISCINEPSIYTFAYAIVMKKEVDSK